MSATYPLLVDVEASGLGPSSYPIEVAWSDPAGEVEEHLIEPPDEWLTDLEWDPSAERIHGIPLLKLTAEGEPIGQVCEAFLRSTHGHPLYSDAPNYDRSWLLQILEYGGFEDARIGVRDAIELYQPKIFGVHLRMDAAKLQARVELGLRHHRAGDDVRALLAVYRQFN